MAKEQSVQGNGSAAHLIKGEQLDNIIETVSNVSEQAVETSRQAMDKSVKMVKEYPLHSAIGAGVLGFAVGFISSKILK